ncbi:hypothetical protein [Cellulomonas iranensis]|uniref:hypothetical protein n=1 Tax=Cellulomonas iranensis TaxID=76862 RepID=UPI0013D5F900|nr:hypothetical protein [Cellulomonas iranensis]
MTTYTISRTREGLDAALPIRSQSLLGGAECLTDLPDAEWDSLPQHIEPGTEVQVTIRARHGGRWWRMGAWIRAEHDELTDLNDARDRPARDPEQRAAQRERRYRAARAAVAAGMNAGLVAYHAGLTREQLARVLDAGR